MKLSEGMLCQERFKNGTSIILFYFIISIILFYLFIKNFVLPGMKVYQA